MKLGQLLKQPQFKNIQVLNQEADLSVNIITVGMIEAPDIAEYVMEGQLLITNGYQLVDNTAGLINLIEVMKQRKAVAIGIKANRYLKHIPDEVITVANQNHFPMLQLPDDVSLSVTVRQIMQTVLKQRTDQLSKIMNDTLAISKYILAKRSDNEILNHITKLLNCNAYIINSLGHLTAKNSDAPVDDDLFEYIATELNLINIVKPTSLLNRYMLFPLKTTNDLTRRFVIFSLSQIEDSGQSLLVENMTNLLSLESMQVSININEERSRRSEVFETILSQSMPEETFANSLNLNGLDFDDHYQAVAIDEATSFDTGKHQAAMHSVSEYVYWYFAKLQIPIVVINWHFKIFVLVKTEQSLAPILDTLNHFLNERFMDSHNLIGYTSYIQPLIHFKRLLREANEALVVAKRLGKQTPNQFVPQKVNDILHLLPQTETQMFVDAVLGPILNAKQDERDQFIELLKQYFDDNQSISQAATNLFIHRNTAVYRLKKIENLLHMDLRNAKDSEQMRLAVKLYLINYN